MYHIHVIVPIKVRGLGDEGVTACTKCYRIVTDSLLDLQVDDKR